MAQYQFGGQMIGRDSRGFLTELENSGLTVNLADGLETIIYEVVSVTEGLLPEVVITSPVLRASFGGRAFEDGIRDTPAFPTSDDYTTRLGRVDWGDDRSSLVLSFRFEFGFGPVREHFITLAGDPLPRITTLNAFDFFNSISFYGVADGEFAPGQPISLAEAPDVFVLPLPLDLQPDPPVVLAGSEDSEALSGGSGNDRLDGAGGNDTLEGGDGADTLIGGDGDDSILGGATADDLRDVVYAGAGNDSVDGGAGNDELWGGAGDDTMEGGAGVDTLRGQDGDDVLTGSAFSDLIFGGDGFDFINGGFGSDRVNGGEGADRFFHVGVAGHGSDWIQDFSHAEGDRLVYGGSATRAQFQVNIATTAGAGEADTDEAFVIYRPTGQILWALVDGAGQASIDLQIGGQVFDLIA